MLDWIQACNLDIEAPLGTYKLWGVYKADQKVIGEGKTLRLAIHNAMNIFARTARRMAKTKKSLPTHSRKNKKCRSRK
jgi:hypothetical protein